MVRARGWIAGGVVAALGLAAALPAGAAVGDADLGYGGGDGVASLTSAIDDGTVTDLEAAADGSAVVLLTNDTTTDVLRVTADGADDTAFGGSLPYMLVDLLPAEGGGWWAFGQTDPDVGVPGVAGVVVRLDSDGQPASSFSGDGVALLDVAGESFSFVGGQLLDGGGVQAIGMRLSTNFSFGSGVASQAYDATGAAVGGPTYQELNPASGVSYYVPAEVVARPAGGVAALGWVAQSPAARFPVAVGFTPTGTVDAGYGTAGIVGGDAGDDLGEIADATVLPDGRIVGVLNGVQNVSGQPTRTRWVVAADGSSSTSVGAATDVTEGWGAIVATAGSGLVVANAGPGIGAPAPASSSLSFLAADGSTRATASAGTTPVTALATIGGSDVLAAGAVPGSAAGVEVRRFAASAPVGPESVNPQRIFDTRAESRMGYAGDKPGADGVVRVQVAGQGGVPASGASAVMLNVTATEATQPGYVTAWPAGQDRPLASILNLVDPGQTVAALVTVPLGDDGAIDLYTQSGTHLLVDVAAWFPVGEGFTPLSPTRILDTRPSTAVAHSGPKPGTDGEVTLRVLGSGGVPASGVSAVVLTVTATEATAAGYVTVWPADVERPLASNLNLRGEDHTVANQVIVPPSASGDVKLYTQSGTHLLADVSGYFTADGTFTSLTPARILDTRPGSAVHHPGATPGPEVETAFDIAGQGGVPPTGARAAILNVTATNTTAAGYVSLWPSGAERRTASILNATGAGQTVANLAIVPIGADGRAVLLSQSGADLVVDVAGWIS